jgi:TonB family protein
MSAWLTYVLLVSAALGLAALGGEAALRSRGWPGRWAWAAALVGSLGLPVVAWLATRFGGVLSPASPPAGFPLPGTLVMETLPPLMALVGGVEGTSLGAVFLVLWLAGSLALVLYIGVTALRLGLAMSGWARREVDGVEVLVSRATGPAAIGLWRGRVVVPEWALGLDPAQRRLLVLHEAEHVRAGDPQLAVAGLAACALMPWNPLVWWQWSRLRLAIELDCDARVLGRTGDPATYGSLLLDVGQRRARLALGLAEPKSMLERRIRMITKTTRRRLAQAAGFAVVAALLVAVACETPWPTGVKPGAPTSQTTEPVADADGPTFTPMTVRPQLLNVAEVQAALQQYYPPLLRNAGIEGIAHVWFHIDEDGQVTRTLLQHSSGRDELDLAALRLAEMMRFSPAYNRDQRVAVWVTLPIAFGESPVPPAAKAVWVAGVAAFAAARWLRAAAGDAGPAGRGD